MFDPATYLTEAQTRIARADNEAFASGLAFGQGPDAFLAHLKKTQSAALEGLYRELGYDSASNNQAASETERTDPAVGSDLGKTPGQ